MLRSDLRQFGKNYERFDGFMLEEGLTAHNLEAMNYLRKSIKPYKYLIFQNNKLNSINEDSSLKLDLGLFRVSTEDDLYQIFEVMSNRITNSWIDRR